MKYHSDLVNALLKLMREEQYIKLQTQASSCMVNFVRGLVNTEEGSDEVDEENRKILLPYI